MKLDQFFDTERRKMDKNKLEGDELKFFEPEIEEIDIPEQKEFYELPVRFGAIPLDEAPFGWEVETRRKQTKITKFEHAFPKIRLPFQEVLREDFGHSDEFEKNPLFPTGSNRLFFGDNLYVMRQLPSKSIDLIYIAPPFFSGRNDVITMCYLVILRYYRMNRKLNRLLFLIVPNQPLDRFWSIIPILKL